MQIAPGSWFKQVRGLPDYRVLTSHYLGDISQPVLTTLANPPLVRSLSKCNFHLRVKLRYSYDVSNHGRYSVISRLIFIKVNKTKKTFRFFEQWIIRPFISPQIAILTCLINSSDILCLHASQSHGCSSMASNIVELPFHHSMLLAVVSNTKTRTPLSNSKSFTNLNKHFAIISPVPSEISGDSIKCPERLDGELRAITGLSSVFPSINFLIFPSKWKTKNVSLNYLKDAKESLISFASVWT